MIFSEKMFFFPAVGGYVRTRKAKETFGYFFFIDLFILWKCIQVSVDLLDNLILFKQGFCYEEGILQVYLILLVIAVICKFGIAG